MQKLLVLKKTKKEYSDTWVPTVLSAISLLLLILAGAGVITNEQQAQLSPLLSSTTQVVSVIIAGVLQIIKIIFKQPTTPTV